MPTMGKLSTGLHRVLLYHQPDSAAAVSPILPTTSRFTTWTKSDCFIRHLHHVLCGLDLLQRPGDGDDAIARSSDIITELHVRSRVQTNLPDALSGLANHYPGQLHTDRYQNSTHDDDMIVCFTNTLYHTGVWQMSHLYSTTYELQTFLAHSTFNKRFKCLLINCNCNRQPSFSGI